MTKIKNDEDIKVVKKASKKNTSNAKSSSKTAKKTIKNNQNSSVGFELPKIDIDLDSINPDDYSITEDDEFEYLENNRLKTPQTADALDSNMEVRLSENAIENNFIQMAKFKTLTKAEEFDLARRIEVGLFAAHKLEKNEVKKKDIEDYNWLVEDGKRAKTIFTNANRKLIAATIKKMSNTTSIKHADYNTLTIYGQIGLDMAINKYDYKKGLRFSTFAVMRIWATINSEVTKNIKLVKIPQHILEKIRRKQKSSMMFESEHGRTPTIEEIAEILEIKVSEVKLLIDAESNERSIHDTFGDIDGSLYIDTVEDESLEGIYDSEKKKHDDLKLKEVLEKIATKDEKAKIAFSLWYGFDSKYGRIEKTQLGELLNIGEQQVDNLVHRAEAKVCHPAFGLLTDVSGTKNNGYR